MSKHSWLEVDLAKPVANSTDVLHVLASAGWEFEKGGTIIALPLGDGDFGWARMTISRDEAFSLFKQKDRNRELVGVVVLWEGSELGCNLHVRDRRKLEISLSINRRTLGVDSEFTDVSWYLTNLVWPVAQMFPVERLSWSEY